MRSRTPSIAVLDDVVGQSLRGPHAHAHHHARGHTPPTLRLQYWPARFRARDNREQGGHTSLH